ncbi:MAG: serine protease [Firmicutes bacterium HGW-Firmicutes-15]|nr:MAG: serine protease [Firmicutes bacterium HGW-Firmicutes-15]
MKYIYKKSWQHFLSLLLCLCLFLQISIYPVLANDRSADIIGSSPLLVPNLLTPSGLSGKGQIVGIADSGLDKGSMTDIHPDLQSDPGTMPKVVMLKSYTDRELPDDPNGHGTFMAATIAGSGKASQGQYQGIAPGASLYFQALLDKVNNLKVPERLEDLFRPAYSAGVRIHVDGWGGGSNAYSASSVQIDDFVYKYQDFMPVFGAGNSGPGSGTLTSEANSKNALTVGSSQVPRPAFGPEARFADQSAESSSRGPTADGRIKPEILAPGSALISANSSLIEGNFAANSFYNRMGGSSMAAAVTGGALALLREQLKTDKNMPDPSSALLKALLINGARSQTGDPTQEGFGILDLAGTVLALQEGTFKISDEKTGLKAEEIREYKLQVNDPSLPIKITLAWVDPPGTPGAASALVNNLDLIVQEPGGKSYYGNDFSGQGRADYKNNVEQVSIPVSKTGEYIIKVKATSIGRAGSMQNFALVYGQPLKSQVITEINKNELNLLDGTKVNLAELKLHQVVDGSLVNSTAGIQVGSDIYLSAGVAYIFGRTWKTGGIQALPTSEGDLLLEMNTKVREGGYYLAPQAVAAGAGISVNGLPVASITDIPSGAELKATINPALQTLWKLEAVNQETSGFIEQVNTEAKEVKLVHDPHIYKLAAWAAISYRDKLLDCTVQDTPYGTAEQNDLDKLMPGMKVTMQVSPKTQVVQSLLLERPMVIGRVESVDIAEEKIVLDSGKTYQIFPGASFYRDEELVKLEDIKSGDRIVALLMPDSSSIMQLRAFSYVSYGRVVYTSPKQKSLYLIDSNNSAHNFALNKQTEVFGWGIPLEFTSILPGSWVRVIADPTGKEAWRIDLAEIGEAEVKILSSVNPDKKILSMTDGSKYTYSSSTRISKGGYSINALDIMPGEKVNLTTLLSHSPWPQVLAGVEVELIPQIKVPDTELTARSLNGVLIIQGNTTADRLYLYRQDGSTERITVVDGRVSRIYRLLDNETELRLVILDTRSGGMKASDLKISVYQPQPAQNSFNDISGHWAENYIKDLARRNFVNGYGDGSYRPDQTLSRAELVSIIASLHDLTLTVMGEKPNFIDYQDIPWWALEAVLAAKEHGLISGYADGSFQPARAVTRSEMAVILSRLAGETKAVTSAELPYQDSEQIPSWARDAFVQLYERGLLTIFPGELLEPNRPVTRAEAAALLDKI